jgi:DNA-binding NtrC family response regulator
VAGNIRELQNVIERAVILSNASVSPADRHQGMMDVRP